MNRDPVTSALAAGLVISVMLTAALCYAYLHVAQNNRLLQSEVARLNAQRNLMQPLAMESLEFSRKHPSIIPVLRELGVRPVTDTSNPPSAQP
ncbi:MAG TPA: hypothetical protein VF773_01350 [Verrucomicrobiae bacterium]